MTPEKIKQIIAGGEGIEVEFKESKAKLNKDLFESVCAFLNRHGGHIFLGVNDNGEVTGLDSDKVEDLKNDFITTINNPQKMTPSVYLAIDVVEIDGKPIIYIYVPESSQVHSTAGKTFDRNGDADLDITHKTDLVANLHLRKQTTYTENRIFPYATMADLKPELMRKVKIMAGNHREGGHPWEAMTDMEFLKSAGLYKTDRATGLEGLTMAALLLFGTEEAILSVCPHYKTDAILRVDNLDRYDDRDVIMDNLIESFTRLMEFVNKHLKDPFYLEGQQRISIRTKIFREAVVNLLIHREFANAFPAKMIIARNQVTFENANRPHGFGEIDPNNFVPFPKNPHIARVFREIGMADELGSGVKNLFKYTKEYAGGDPRMMEEDLFRAIIPIEDPQSVFSESLLRNTSQKTREKTRGKTREKTREKAGGAIGGQIDNSSEKTREKETVEVSPDKMGNEMGNKTGNRMGNKMGNKLSENRQKILDAMRIDSTVSQTKLVEVVGISSTNIEKNIKYLKEHDWIRRLGGTRGHWEVIDLDNAGEEK